MSAGAAATGAWEGGGERLVLTLLFSALLHGVVLLGVGFGVAQPAAAPPMLDIILVATGTSQAPDQADFLAQANQEGGGDLDEAVRPTSLANAPVLESDPGDAPLRQEAAAPRAETTPVPVLSTPGNDNREPVAVAPNEPVPTRNESEELLRLQEEIATLAAEQANRQQEYAKRPRKKFISAQTREYFYAAYLKAWDARIERISNREYPAQFARHGLHGQLIMTVEIEQDGRVASVEIIDPSPHRLLNESAIQIVHRAAPFNPFPRDPDEPVDILHITRTWQFLPSGEVRQR
ncbi:MAG: TonB family protein [Xanthomonadales bacterium]|nr:TonB family protein [Xanthomonadales bacterium]